MAKNIFTNYIYPIATLAGSIIGVGFLSLPYLAVTVGVPLILVYLAVLTFFVVCIHVMFARVSLATPDFKRWPGFVGYYFGPWAKKSILLLVSVGAFGVLLVYLIVGSQFLATLLMPVFGGSPGWYALLYFCVASALVYVGVGTISKFEFWALLLLMACIGAIFLKGFSVIHIDNFFAPGASFSPATFFLPFGAIMFSLWGTGLIPEAEEMLRGNKKSFIWVVAIGTLIPAVLYLVFTLLVVGITGARTTESALVGLGNFLGSGIVSVALAIGILTTFTAFICQGLLLKKVFMYDMGMKSLPAFLLSCFTPLVLYFLGVNSFIVLISFIGGALTSIDGILILLMYRKIGGTKLATYPLLVFFIAAFAYSLYYFFR